MDSIVTLLSIYQEIKQSLVVVVWRRLGNNYGYVCLADSSDSDGDHRSTTQHPNLHIGRFTSGI